MNENFSALTNKKFIAHLYLKPLIYHLTIIMFLFLLNAPTKLYGKSGSVIVWGNSNNGPTNVPSGLTNCVSIAAGKNHCLAALEDGRVVAWGDNQLGQLNIPPQATNVVLVSAGLGHSVALRKDLTVVAWGYNDAGQTNVPAGLSGVVSIASGDSFNLALLSDGRIVGWGGPQYGISPGRPPQYLTNGSMPAISIGAGNSHGLAVDGYYRVCVWGTSDPRLTQIPAGLTNLQYRAVAVAGGSAHCLALLDNGYVVGWGDNYFGQSYGISGAKAIAAYGNTSMAILQDNRIVVWGDNTFGQHQIPSNLSNLVSIAAGDGYCMAIYLEPVKITSQPQNQSAIVGNNVIFLVSALGSQPIAYQWQHQGTNLPNCTNYVLTLQNVQSNQAGSYKVIVSNEISSEESQSATLNVWVPPIIITQPTNQSIPLGGMAQFSVNVQGTSPFYYQWRKNGTNIPNTTVVPYKILNVQSSDTGDYSVVISNIAGVVTSAIAHLTVNLPPTILVQPKSQTVMVGSSVSFNVVDSGGTSYQWKKNGVNISGATNSIYTISSVKKDDAGNYSVAVSNAGGTVTSQNAVLTVIEPQSNTGMVVIWGQSSNIWNGYEYIDLIPPAGLTNVALLAAGSFHCLALLKNGQVIGWGDNRYGKASVSISSIKSIAAGQNHSIALLSNGTIYVWGDNTYGQTNPPNGLTNLIAIESGLNHCLVLKSNKTVVGWGNNVYGQATPIAGLTNVIAIAAGAEHSLALRSDGTVASWGRNDDGQTRVPAGLSNVVAIAGGGGHSLALLSNGTVTCWGRNNYGQSTPPLNLSNVKAIAAGENHSIALLSDNTVVCWGADNYGQIEVPEDLKGVVCLTAGPTYNLAAFLKPLELKISHYFSNTYQIQASRVDASPIENWRLNQINLLYSTNLTVNNWTILNANPSYDNGSLFYMILITNNLPMFYRIVESP